MVSPKVWIIQNDLQKLKMALESINNESSTNYLYTNCISHFNFDEVQMSSKNFNTFLYSEDTNTCIVFMKDSIKEINYAKNYLKGNYHEISLKNEREDIVNRFPHSLHNYERYEKEIWIANNEKELTEILEMNMEKQRKKIAYYPLIDSNIMINYSCNSDKEHEIKKFLFNGVIVTFDKIILLPKNNENKDILEKFIKNAFNNMGARYVTMYFNRPKFINMEEKRNEMYNEEYVLSKSLR